MIGTVSWTSHTTWSGGYKDLYPMTSGIPFLQIDSPLTGVVTSSSVIQLEGYADANSTLTINGDLVYMEGSGHFSAAVSLTEGLNHIKLMSKSSYYYSIKFVDVYYDDPLADSYGNLSASLNQTQSLLNSTRAWVQNLDSILSASYDKGNQTLENVTYLLGQVTGVKASLISLRDSLSTTDANATQMRGEISAEIARLSELESSLNKTKADLSSTQNDVNGLKNDVIPLMLGVVALIIALAAIAMVVMRGKKGGSP